MQNAAFALAPHTHAVRYAVDQFGPAHCFCFDPGDNNTYWTSHAIAFIRRNSRRLRWRKKGSAFVSSAALQPQPIGDVFIFLISAASF